LNGYLVQELLYVWMGSKLFAVGQFCELKRIIAV
jgi:hypothetical protein